MFDCNANKTGSRVRDRYRQRDSDRDKDRVRCRDQDVETETETEAEAEAETCRERAIENLPFLPSTWTSLGIRLFALPILGCLLLNSFLLQSSMCVFYCCATLLSSQCKFCLKWEH